LKGGREGKREDGLEGMKEGNGKERKMKGKERRRGGKGGRIVKASAP
jgi:hypothetical protein